MASNKIAGRLFLIVFLAFAGGCISGEAQISPKTAMPARTVETSMPLTVTPVFMSPTPLLTETGRSSETSAPAVPVLKHVVILVFENKEFETVIGNPGMPVYNRYAQEYTLFDAYYAITHPSLPNYLALIAGDTFRIQTDYPDTVIDAPTLPDMIEAGGRTWKAYMESMPEACALQDTLSYVQKHNPFVFFKSIRDDAVRCREHVVPLEDLDTDMLNGTLPNYVFITPNLCNTGHDTFTRPEECGYEVVDHWLAGWLDKLVNYPGLMDDGVIVLTWDEGQGNHSCCGFETGGGRIPTVFISNRVKAGFIDSQPYTHYSLLRTISESWSLPVLGNARDNQKAPPITAPWQ